MELNRGLAEALKKNPCPGGTVTISEQLYIEFTETVAEVVQLRGVEKAAREVIEQECREQGLRKELRDEMCMSEIAEWLTDGNYHTLANLAAALDAKHPS